MATNKKGAWNLKQYEVILDPKAEKVFKEIKDKKLSRRIANIFDMLSISYHTLGKALLGEWKGCYSIKTFSYRIIYEILHSKCIVYILKIQHRRDVYK